VAPGVPVVAPFPVAPEPGQAATAQPGIFNQPVVINTFERVEMERLRIAEELTKTQREDLAFREQVVKLTKKLASSSLSVAAPESIPTDYRTFLSLSEGAIATSQQYYALLKSALNDLTPQSPYLARTKGEGANPQRASATLLSLDRFAEDDGVSRTLRGHLAEFYGGQRDDASRIRGIDGNLAELDREKKQLEFQMRNTEGNNPLSGRPRGTDDDRAAFKERIATVTQSQTQLRQERQSLSHVVTEVQRKLQFQQYIVELAFQQRYIHALIACGFYRGAPSKGDLAINPQAYPSGRGNGPAGGAAGFPTPGAPGNVSMPANEDPFSKLNPTSAIPAASVPVIATVSGMEAFLTNRIRDAIKDREAMDNMLKEKQMSAAEGLLRKMVMTAKYQPELNTIPYGSRQLIHGYGQDMRALTDALQSRDYAEMRQIAKRIEKTGTDAGMKDIELFATEQPSKALYLVRQAELALKASDRKAAQSMTDAAVARAPLEPEVKDAIEKLQNLFLNNSRLAEDLEKVVEAGDYQSAYSRANEFGPLAAQAPDRGLRTKFEMLMEREKNVRAALERCDAFEKRASYADGWLALSNVDAAIAEDARIVRRMSGVMAKCPRFVAAYTKASEHEKAGAHSIALAWYLSALADAPGNTELVDKVNNLGTQVINR